MKHLLLLLSLILGQLTSYAQQGTINSTGNIPDELANIYAPLDKTKIPTGFLVDMAMPFGDLEDFDGKNLNNTNLVDADRFGMLYATIYGSCIDGKKQLPSPSTYMNAIKGNNIPMALMLMRYNEIDENALNNNLLTYKNGQFFDVVNRKQEPYNESLSFVASPMKNNYNMGTNYTFSLSNTNFYSNILKTSVQVEVDFGNGFQKTSMGSSLSYTFYKPGLQEIKIRLSDGQGNSWLSHAQVNIFDKTFNIPNATGRGYSTVPDEEFTISTKSGANVQIFYACPNKKQLRKPMIILDGFDPPELGNRTFEAIFGRLKTPIATGSSTNLIEKIFDEEYDIVFVDWKDGATWLEDNAEVTIDVIKEVNKRKKLVGSVEKNFIIGASMGGVIGKLALANMEEQGIDHETETYFNLDGPMRGANVPLGIQYMANHLTNQPVTISKGLFSVSFKIKDFVPEFEIFEKVMNRPAVKQFLFYHIYAPKTNPYKGGYLESPEHIAFYSMFKNKKLTKCKYVCLSNGSGIGEAQIYGPGDALLDININKLNAHLLIEAIINTSVLPNSDFSLGDKLLAHGILSVASKQLEVTLRINAQPNDNKLGLVYSGSILLKLRKLIAVTSPITISTQHDSWIDNCKHYDSAPGGTLGDIFKFIKTIEVGYKSKFSPLPSPIKVASIGFSFIPMTSSLDIKDPEGLDLFLNTSNVQQTISSGLTQLRNYHVSIDNSVVPYPLPQFGFGILEHNQAHAFPNSQNAPWLVSTITASNPLASLSVLDKRIYNFGDSKLSFNPLNINSILKTKNEIRNNLEVSQVGQLWINHTGKITFTDEPKAPQNSSNSSCELIIKQGGSCADSPTKVSVKNGGKIIIGDKSVNNTAVLFINNGTILEIGVNGLCFIDKNSIIVVKSGGLLIVDGGELKTEANAKIIVEEGGKFINQGFVEVSWGTEIVLKAKSYMSISTNSTLRISQYSKLTAEDNSHINFAKACNIQLWDGNQPNGEAKIDIAGKWTYNGKFNFSGNGYFQIESTHKFDAQNGDIEFEGYGKSFRFMRFNTSSKWHIPKLNGLTIKNGTIEMIDGASIILMERNSFLAQNCIFKGVGAYAPGNGIYASDANTFETIDCDFTKHNYAITLDGADKNKTKPFLIKNCNFSQCGNFVTVSDIDKVIVENTNFDGSSITSGWAILFSNVNDINLIKSKFNSFPIAILLAGNVPLLRMIGGSIENSEIGIGMDEETKSNIFMSQQATIKNCGVGIDMKKGGIGEKGTLDWGLIDINCANILYNKIGIKGEDILLAIDAYLHAPINCFSLRPNRFECSLGQLLFDVCYIQRNIKTVFAKGNYWNGNNYPNPSYFKINNKQCESHYSNVKLDYSNNVKEIPLSCSCNGPFDIDVVRNGEFTINPEILDQQSCIAELCYTYKNGSSETEYCQRVEIMKQFQNAYAELLSGNTSYAKMLFAWIRNAKNISEDNEICNLYVDFAKVISEHIEDPFANVRSSNMQISSNALLPSLNKVKFDEIYPYPNPTSEGFTLALKEKGNYEIKIINNLGVLIEKVEFKDQIYYEMLKLPSGIYYIEVRNLKTSSIQKGRLIYQMY